MRLTLLAYSIADSETVELPANVESYHQVKPLSFDAGTLWVVVLTPDEPVTPLTPPSDPE